MIRYTPEMYNSLGYRVRFPRELCFVNFDKTILDAEEASIKGDFAKVIDVLFSSRDGSLDNNYLESVTENSPDVVKSFVRNVLMCDVPALMSAPDADTALDMIVPRGAISSELGAYREYLRGIIEPHVDDGSKSD